MDATIKEPTKAPIAEILIKSPCRALDSARDKKRGPIKGNDVIIPRKLIHRQIKTSFANIGSKNIYGIDRIVAINVRKRIASMFELCRM